MKTDDTSRYWDSVLRSFRTNLPQSLWRAHSDQVNIALLHDWLGGRHFDALLKTDLFDEALNEGLCPMLQAHSARVHAVDISKASVRAAQQRYPWLETVCADVRDLPYADERFDVIVSNSTLDHFQSTRDIEAGLGELFRVLRSGGELLITLDNLQNPVIRLRSLLPFRFWKRLGLVPYYVGKTLGRHGLIRALEKTGFRVVETRAIMHCPRVLAVPIAGALERRTSLQTRKRFLSLLLKFEHLAAWPTRFVTGHFVAARGAKP